MADRGQVSTDPMPPPVPDTRTALPGRAGWYALAGFLLGQVAAVADYLLGVQLAPDSLVLPLLVSQLGLWTGLIDACLLASRRWGTGPFEYVASRNTYGTPASQTARGARGDLLVELGADPRNL